MHIICLTGGFASGKSTAIQHLADKGALIISADLLGHGAYAPDTPAYHQVIETFGEDVRGSDGEIDRMQLGRKVFGKPLEMGKLTAIVWPEIRRLIEAEIAAIKEKTPEAIVVLEAAVLFEAGWDDLGDAVWVLIVEAETAIARAMMRDQKINRKNVEAVLSSQWSNERRTARAGRIIHNDGSLEEMHQALDAAWQEVPSP